MNVDAPIRVLVVGAHPDEADMYAGGTAALYAEMGHEVRFLSLTNGDGGHQELGRFELAARREREAAEAARRLGLCGYDVLDTHCSELFPTLEIRQRVMRTVRQWRADVVIGFHPVGGGHPDNRAAGVAVRDALSFVALRNAMPEVPALERNPLGLLMVDYATQGIHRHDVAIDVDGTIEKKLLACDAHATQFYEFSPYQRGFLDQVPEGWDRRREFILRYWPEFMYASDAMRPHLERWYGPARAGAVRFAETFTLANPGVDEERIRRLLPMLPAS